MLDSLERGLAGCERVFLFAANGLLITMLAINLANILSRLILDTGIIWVFPWTEVLFVWMIFLGFFVIYRRNQDITIDILVRRLGPTTRAVLQIVVGVIIASLMLLLLYQALTLVPRQVGRIDMVGLQRYWLSIPFFVSCTLIVVLIALDIARAIAILRGVEPAVRPGATEEN
ncbi:TRAP transporter small permease subunit [Mesorhizobium sp. CAU 1741]|uniref:TRAP transporter small permease n=1 Tax=Mesorhizobium sp. CAU 1741 TaxID=3140366 RepID=UPI00325BE451